MSKDRLAAFTDAVLAIIMTILVLELERPETPTLEAFWDLRESFLPTRFRFGGSRRFGSATTTFGTMPSA